MLSLLLTVGIRTGDGRNVFIQYVGNHYKVSKVSKTELHETGKVGEIGR
jgi:hypothetical protein